MKLNTLDEIQEQIHEVRGNPIAAASKAPKIIYDLIWYLRALEQRIKAVEEEKND